MDIIEYKNQNGKRSYGNNPNMGTLGYILGLIGSSISFLICVFGSLVWFLFDGLVKTAFDLMMGEFLFELSLYNISISEEQLYRLFNQFGIIIMIVMFIGFILSIVGTVSYKNKQTIISCVLMIIGGILSLFPLFVSGILVIVGGIINLVSLLRRS